MALEITAERQAKTAINSIGKFNVKYDFDHFPGKAPEVIRARGAVEGQSSIVDAMYYPGTGNFSTTFHHLTDDINVTLVGDLLSDMRQLAENI